MFCLPLHKTCSLKTRQSQFREHTQTPQYALPSSHLQAVCTQHSRFSATHYPAALQPSDITWASRTQTGQSVSLVPPLADVWQAPQWHNMVDYCRYCKGQLVQLTGMATSMLHEWTRWRIRSRVNVKPGRKRVLQVCPIYRQPSI